MTLFIALTLLLLSLTHTLHALAFYTTYNFVLQPLSTKSTTLYNPDIELSIAIEFESTIYIIIGTLNNNNETIKLNILNDTDWNEITIISSIHPIDDINNNKRFLLEENDEEEEMFFHLIAEIAAATAAGTAKAVLSGTKTSDKEDVNYHVHRKEMRLEADTALAKLEKEKAQIKYAMKTHHKNELRKYLDRVETHKERERIKEMKFNVEENKRHIKWQKRMIKSRLRYYRDYQKRSRMRARKRARRRRRRKQKELKYLRKRREVKFSNQLREKETDMHRSERTYRMVSKLTSFKKFHPKDVNCRQYRYNNGNNGNNGDDGYYYYNNRRGLIEEEEFLGVGGLIMHGINLVSMAVEAAKRAVHRSVRKVQRIMWTNVLKARERRLRKLWKKLEAQKKKEWVEKHKEHRKELSKLADRNRVKRMARRPKREEWERRIKMYTGVARRYHATQRRAARLSRRRRRIRRRKIERKEFERTLNKQYRDDQDRASYKKKTERVHDAYHLLDRLLKWQKNQRKREREYCRNKLNKKRIRRRILDFDINDMIIDYVLKCKIIQINDLFYKICIKYDMVDKYLSIDINKESQYNLLEEYANYNGYFDELEMMYNNVDNEVDYIQCSDELSNDLPFKVCLKQFNEDSILYFDGNMYDFNNDNEWDEINIIKPYKDKEHMKKCINHLSMAIVCVEQFDLHHGIVSITFIKTSTN